MRGFLLGAIVSVLAGCPDQEAGSVERPDGGQGGEEPGSRDSGSGPTDAGTDAGAALDGGAPDGGAADGGSVFDTGVPDAGDLEAGRDCTGSVRLTPVSSARVSGAVDGFEANRCGLGAPSCQATLVGLWEIGCGGSIEDFVAAIDGEVRFVGEGGGRVLSRAEVESLAYVRGPNGAALLSEFDAFAGSSDVEGWWAEDEVPCPNCTQFQISLVLFYPSDGRAGLIQGTYGWGS